MSRFESVDDVLDFAIAAEAEACEFYADLAAKASNDQMRRVFEEFAREEAGHKVRLEGIKKGGAFRSSAAAKVTDLKIADYTVPVEVGPDMNYQDAIVLAMQKEKAAFKLYSDLAWLADDPEMKDMFIMLAQEEARHKLRFEIEFDEIVLKEN